MTTLRKFNQMQEEYSILSEMEMLQVFGGGGVARATGTGCEGAGTNCADTGDKCANVGNGCNNAGTNCGDNASSGTGSTGTGGTGTGGTGAGDNSGSGTGGGDVNVENNFGDVNQYC